mgnify:FL=1
MSAIVIPADHFAKVFVNLIDSCINRIEDAARREVGEKAYGEGLNTIDLCEDLLKSDGQYHPEVRIEIDQASKRLDEAYDEFDEAFAEDDDEL